ncbi:hypothetical protein WMY93_012128 [Mugilogobius chulae]|uniref:Uncharacterized protein n=1 Tax=Mugilogobius chulae TaxID=88201 RepID=A0AAW0P804_9GOBI
MEQMEDEMSTKVNLKNIGKRTDPEERPTPQTGERTQNQSDTSEYKLESHLETEESDQESQQPQQCEKSTSPLFSLRMYLKRPPSLDSNSSTVSLTSLSTNTGFLRHDSAAACLLQESSKSVLSSIPASGPTVQSPVSSEGSYTDWDCGLLASCKDASDCLELAMEVSEMCYH